MMDSFKSKEHQLRPGWRRDFQDVNSRMIWAWNWKKEWLQSLSGKASDRVTWKCLRLNLICREPSLTSNAASWKTESTRSSSSPDFSFWFTPLKAETRKAMLNLNIPPHHLTSVYWTPSYPSTNFQVHQWSKQYCIPLRSLPLDKNWVVFKNESGYTNNTFSPLSDEGAT